MTILDKLTHFSKAHAPITNISPKSTLVKETHPLKQFAPRDLTLFDNLTLLRLAQFSNALSPTLVMLSPISIDEMELLFL